MPRSIIRLPILIRQAFWGLRAAVAAGLLLLVGALIAGAAPTLFGYESYVVLSGSMEPALQVGDLSVVGAVRPEDLRVGDIISYRTPSRPNTVVTHRLVGIGTNAAGRLAFETRGDANDSTDQVDVDAEAVLGRVAYAVPKVGYLVDFAKRPLGKGVLLGLPALLLIADALFSRRAGRGRTRAVTDPHTEAPTAETLVRQAWVAQRNGRLGEALGLLDRATTLYPSSEDAWLLKADCLQNPGARLTCLWEALAANPGSVALHAASEEAARRLTEAPELSLDEPAGPVHARYARVAR